MAEKKAFILRINPDTLKVVTKLPEQKLNRRFNPMFNFNNTSFFLGLLYLYAVKILFVSEIGY